jgi:hypothetical protein
MELKEFEEKTKDMTPEEKIKFFEDNIAFKFGAPGYYLTDLAEEIDECE